MRKPGQRCWTDCRTCACSMATIFRTLAASSVRPACPALSIWQACVQPNANRAASIFLKTLPPRHAADAQGLEPGGKVSGAARELSDSEWRVAPLPTVCRPAYGGFGLTDRELALAAARASLDDVARQRHAITTTAASGLSPLAAAAAAGVRAADAARAVAGDAREQLGDGDWLRIFEERRHKPVSPLRR